MAIGWPSFKRRPFPANQAHLQQNSTSWGGTVKVHRFVTVVLKSIPSEFLKRTEPDSVLLLRFGKSEHNVPDVRVRPLRQEPPNRFGLGQLRRLLMAISVTGTIASGRVDR
ncbi:hypothetical protein Fuma_03600 [Fuerstiella marisgermanici]|uniref:Uncharacterized protein n=1 Tax=Fuerstiella marisgermanici TaxID=1891926 RepID=A0A1P8WIT4_9PLAN|nr:hypothetical protein Fuma_03600 [Fuerstiella marisgermanici]